MGVDLLILSDQIVGNLMMNVALQERFPTLKVSADLFKSSSGGCRCNGGQRRRQAIQQAKTSILESSAQDKLDFKKMINANRVRITGFQHGKPVIVTF